MTKSSKTVFLIGLCAAVLGHPAARAEIRYPQAVQPPAAAKEPSSGQGPVAARKPLTEGLVIRSLDGKLVRQIPLTGASDRVPMWSPDGKSLAYVARLNGKLVLTVVDREGGTPRVFQEAVSSPGQSFKWSTDSKTIGFLDPDRHRFQLLDIASGKVRVVVEDSSGAIFGSWMWRPDGRSIVSVMASQGTVPGLRGARRRID